MRADISTATSCLGAERVIDGVGQLPPAVPIPAGGEQGVSSGDDARSG
jgi:hypothetical protein